MNTNKVALVTGSGAGIGRAIALALAKEGVKIIVNDVNETLAKNVANEIMTLGSQALPFASDISDRQKVFSMVEQAIKQFGRIDILVNNAGVGSNFLIEDMPPEIWDRNIGINLTGSFNCTKAVAPHMIKQKSGKIIFISSVGGHRTGGRGASDYITTKHGILGFMKAMAYELGIHGINVNAICPGAVITEMLRKSASDADIEAMKKEMPTGDVCMPEDIAGAVLYLVSDAAKCVTGHSLNVESGVMLGAGTNYTNIMQGKMALSKQLLEKYNKEKK